MECFNCGKILEGRLQKKFCSQSCSASFNNRVYPKRRAGWISCPSCKMQYLKKDLPPNCYCSDCKQKRSENLLYRRDPTKSQVVYEKHTNGAAYAYIRWHARKIVMKGFLMECCVCGYDKHVEVSHIQSIASFEDSARLSQINSVSNLAILCPNHHWELDHKHLVLVGAEGNAPSSID